MVVVQYHFRLQIYLLEVASKSPEKKVDVKQNEDRWNTQSIDEVGLVVWIDELKEFAIVL